MCGESRIRTCEGKPSDLQSDLVGRLSISPTYYLKNFQEPMEGLEPTTC